MTKNALVLVLWPRVATKTVCRLLCYLRGPDGWIRGGDDLRCEGERRQCHG